MVGSSSFDLVEAALVRHVQYFEGRMHKVSEKLQQEVREEGEGSILIHGYPGMLTDNDGI